MVQGKVNSRTMKSILRKSRRFALRLIVFVGVLFFVFNFVRVGVNIIRKTREIRSINEQILIEKQRNREISEKLEEIENIGQASSDDSNISGSSSDNVRIFENIVQ